mgnify:CR=1 FL=1
MRSDARPPPPRRELGARGRGLVGDGLPRVAAEVEGLRITALRPDAEHPVTRGLHVGFRARDRAQVDAFWQAVQERTPLEFDYQRSGEQAPATYKAKFDTSKGAFVIEVQRDWAPNGADRFFNLVKNGFYDNVRFFRVISVYVCELALRRPGEVGLYCLIGIA